jgi:hypothetical protein
VRVFRARLGQHNKIGVGGRHGGTALLSGHAAGCAAELEGATTTRGGFPSWLMPIS